MMRVLLVRVLLVGLGITFALACGGESAPTAPTPTTSEEKNSAPGTSAVVVPDSIPDDFPRHPSMTVLDLDNTTYGQGLVVKFESDAALADLRAFYEKQFPASGWHISVSREIDDRLVFFADKGGLEVDLEIFKQEPHRIEMSLYAPDPEDLG